MRLSVLVLVFGVGVGVVGGGVGVGGGGVFVVVGVFVGGVGGVVQESRPFDVTRGCHKKSVVQESERTAKRIKRTAAHRTVETRSGVEDSRWS